MMIGIHTGNFKVADVVFRNLGAVFRIHLCKGEECGKV